MGWSCRQDAYNTMKAWEDFCHKQTGSSNQYQTEKQAYFFEASRTEHVDGAITGAVWKMLPENKARKSGTFRIEGDGKVTRMPTGLAVAMAEMESIELHAEENRNYNRMIGDSLRRY